MKKRKKEYSLIYWFINKPIALGFLVFSTLSFLFIYIAFQNYLLSEEDKRVEMTNILNYITNNIDQTLKNCYTTTLSLALIINDDGVPEDFDLIGKKLLESNSNIDAVQMVPDGVIKYVYPLKGNEAVIGLDIMHSELFHEEALKSIQSRKMYFAGPFELTQGGHGIVGRLPVYFKNKFWSFSAVIIKMDRLLLTSGINSLNTKNFYLQFSKIDPNTKKEVFFLKEHIKLTNNNHISSYIPDGDWRVTVIDKNSKSLLNLFIVKIFIALLVAFTIAFYTVLLLRRPKELQLLVEAQESKLIKTENKFKTIFEQAALGIANVHSITGKYLEVNNKFCELLGYSEQEMKNINFQSITHPDDLDKDLEYLKKIKQGIIEQYTVEKRYLTKEGKIIWVNLAVTPLFSHDNFEEYTLISIIENITERKINEKTILNSQNRIESLINTIDGIVWECDAVTLKFNFISKKVEDILGYTSEEWLSSDTFWQDHIYHEDRDKIVNYCARKVVEQLDHDFEYRMVKKDGSIIWLRDIVNVVTKNHKPVSLRGIMIDITETKEIETDLNTSFTLVSEQNERLLNFSYIVSHNLRSHTSNISSLISLIQNTDNPNEKEEMMDLLKSVSDSLNYTLVNLNDVVNIQINRSLNIEKINLYNFIETTLKVLSSQIKSNNVTINNLVGKTIEIEYSMAYLESILYNIISNGIRYCHQDRKPIITIKFYLENNLKVLEITDNGIGIDLELNKNKIFGMYKTFSNREDSRGIGLFITKNQVDAMGGNITVESIINEGTTFKIYIL